MENNSVDNDLSKVQIHSLELLKLIDDICMKYQIKYTLIGNTLIGYKEFQGFIPAWPYLTVGMLQLEYTKFCEAFLHDYGHSEIYYILNASNCEQMDVPQSRIMRRSQIILSETRRKDQKYYDYFIEIYPIHYAGNSLQEATKYMKAWRSRYKSNLARKQPPDTIQINNIIPSLVNAYYLRRKNFFSITEEKGTVCTETEQTKYVFFPSLVIHEGVPTWLNTYKNIQRGRFCGIECSIIKDYNNWIKDYYSRTEYEKIVDEKINRAILDGPETIRRVQKIETEILMELDRLCRKHSIKYALCFGTLLGAARHKGFIPWDDDIDVVMLYEDVLKFEQIAIAEMNSKFFFRSQRTDVDCNLTQFQVKCNGTIYAREGRTHFNTHNGIYIDIIPLYYGSKYRILHFLQTTITRFFKTMVWAHMGAESEKKRIKRMYYKQLAKVSNKTAYRFFLKFATIFSSDSEKLSYLTMGRNPFNKAYTSVENYNNLIELEFEGSTFFTFKKYKEILEYTYSEDYLMYPPLECRFAAHLPAYIDTENYEIKEGDIKCRQ